MKLKRKRLDHCNIVMKLISIVVILSLSVPDSAMALAPANRFNPIEDAEERQAWDEETVRSVKAGEVLGKSFRNRVAFRDMSILIGKYLHSGISKYTLVQEIKEHIDAAELALSKTHRDPLLAGFEIDELEYREDENAFYLPLYRQGKKAFYYKYYTEKDEKNPPHITIPLGNGEYVYVDVVKILPDEENEVSINNKEMSSEEEQNMYIELMLRLRKEYPWRQCAELSSILKGELEKMGVKATVYTTPVFLEHYNIDHVWVVTEKGWTLDAYPEGSRMPKKFDHLWKETKGVIALGPDSIGKYPYNSERVEMEVGEEIIGYFSKRGSESEGFGSMEKLAAERSIEPTPGSEKKHAVLFKDAVKISQVREEEKISFIALGTSWIKGYKKGIFLQYDALNPLIKSVRKFCEDNGIRFVEGDDETIVGAVKDIKEKDPGARGVVLAGEGVVNILEECFENAGLENDDSVLFAGVDNGNLTVDSYIRFLEMLTIALRLSARDSVNENIIKVLQVRYPQLGLELVHGRRIKFIPKAEPLDYELFKEICEVQICA